MYRYHIDCDEILNEKEIEIFLRVLPVTLKIDKTPREIARDLEDKKYGKRRFYVSVVINLKDSV